METTRFEEAMAKSNTRHRTCSQGSSISSLLASCDLSGRNSSNPDGSFHFKNKLYSSASEALQAYIEDYDLGRMHAGAGANPGGVSLDTGSARARRFSSHSYPSHSGMR